MYSSQDLVRSNATFMSRVYFWMMLGLAVSGIVAYLTASSPAIMQKLIGNAWIWIGLIIVQLLAVLALTALINRLNFFMACTIYLAYAALTGLTFSVILITFTQQSIAQAFFITSFAFIGLSLFGFITKRDLGPLGSFCMTGLFGLLGFILVTLIFPSILTNAVSMTINVITILIFSGLTAYDTQRIKNFNVGNDAGKASITGALMLYLDFINLFLAVLRLFGNRD